MFVCYIIIIYIITIHTTAKEYDNLSYFPLENPAPVQYNLMNEDPEFYVSKRQIGPFGTMEEPTMVFSPKPFRIVGCVGNYDSAHELLFFVMQGYMKHACPSCGQIFQLTDDPSEMNTEFLPHRSEKERMAHLLKS